MMHLMLPYSEQTEIRESITCTKRYLQAVKIQVKLNNVLTIVNLSPTRNIPTGKILRIVQSLIILL